MPLGCDGHGDSRRGVGAESMEKKGGRIVLDVNRSSHKAVGSQTALPS